MQGNRFISLIRDGLTNKERFGQVAAILFGTDKGKLIMVLTVEHV